MPTVVGRGLSTPEDPSAYTGSAVTPKKGRSRSERIDSNESPTRKSRRLCTRGDLEDPIQVDQQCALPSLNSTISPQKSVLSENLCGNSAWDPSNVEQLKAVKEALHVSTPPKNVVCREDEQDRILNFCKLSVKQEKAASLYVCGCPGTGKSLSIEKVQSFLIKWANEENIMSPDILSINCTSLTSTSEVFSKILAQNYPQAKHNCLTPVKLLQNLYSQKQPPGMKMILVIADELDYLITKDRGALHDLFMLTALPFSKCILIGIANAIDLADRFIPKLQALNCKPIVITFRAYSKDQIFTILQERLGALPYTVFQPQALELCARRVAAASGDMRKALSICRSAIEMLEYERKGSVGDPMLTSLDSMGDQKMPSAGVSVAEKLNNMVRIDHVAVALSKTFKSPVVDTVQSLPQHQQVLVAIFQIILCSAVKLFRGGKQDTTLGELNKNYADVCKSTRITPLGIMELSSLCRVLDDQGILKLGQSREDKLRRVTLKVDAQDIVFALQGIRFFRNCLQ